MKSVISKIFVVVALGILLAHNLTPHHHHDFIEITQHQHDDNDHSAFSFGQVDDNFVLSKSQISVNPDFISQLFFLPNNILLTDNSFSEKDFSFTTHQEFPPPENYHYTAGLRAPPFFLG